MLQKRHQQKWLKLIALFLVGAISQSLLSVSVPDRAIAQSPTAAPSACAEITAPLTSEEQTYAKAAWQYFVNNYQPATGLTNSTGGYPSGTLWDIGNYLMALNAARQLNLIDQADFDYRLNQFLQTLSNLKLFEDALPNKAYNAATGQMTDYGNNPVDRGIGWSALDVGRILAAFHVIRTCHPQYGDWIKGIVSKWNIDRSVKDDQLYGATVLPNKETLLVQEGRLGYEEYAARGYELWGFKASKALALEPYQFVEVNGVKILVDTRDYQSTNANNYVVSESYILDGIEFGLEGSLKDDAASVLEAQKRRFESTGQLTAVSEDNIDQAPYFLYNTVYANGNAWATITDENKPYPQLRSISTKAAFGWRYLYPDNAYAQKVFDAVKDLRSPDGGGFYAGLYEETKQPNKALTGNTNGLILEILHYKARGNRPLIGSSLVTFAPELPSGNASTPTATGSPAGGAQGVATPPANTITVSPIPPVGKPKPSAYPKLARPLTAPERRYAEAAWQYFKTNYQSNTGLVNDRSDMNGATLWGLGDYLAALNAARALDIITAQEFGDRTRHLLGALKQLPLFAGQLPHRGYDTQSLQPVDYGGNPSAQGSSNPTAEGTAWSALDLGRVLAALYTLKNYHPEYTKAVDEIVLEWSYSQVVRDGLLFSGRVTKDENGRLLTQVKPETRLGYEEYAARAFQIWGFNVERSAVGGQYQTTSIESVQVPTGRIPSPQYTVSNPFLLYGLEFGFDPQMRQLVQPLLQAQESRYRRTGTFTAAATTLSDKPPYVINNTITGEGKAWATLTDDGKSVPDARTVSTAAAFAFHALFSDNDYTRKLFEATTDLYNPQQGYYEGFSEKTGKPETALSSSTNSLILQSLLYRATNQQPLIRPETAMNSPWWKAVAAGDLGRGLPRTATQTARWDSSGAYWVSGSSNTPPVAFSAADPPNSPYQGRQEVNPSAFQEGQAVNPPFQGGQGGIVNATVEPTPSSAATSSPTPAQLPEANAVSAASPAVEKAQPLTEADRIAAQQAWQYFDRNWNPKTGLVNSVDNYPWTTLWDQGSAILGIHAARQLGVIQPERFNSMINRLLQTLETLPLPATGVPNKAYSTRTGEMRQLDNTPDPKGTSGWSALDTARFLLGLHVLRTHYPEYQERINRIVEDWNLSQLVKDGWLHGNIPDSKGQTRLLQEGRLGYEQYAAHSLKLWGIEAENALHNPPIQTVEVEGIPLQVDRRNLDNSGATNYLTNEPYLLWGLELGWNEAVKPQVLNLLQVQAQRYERTKILTAVNEDSLDRPPYFLYYSVYANGQSWNATSSKGKAYPQLRFLSTKAAFAWDALMPNDSYANTLRETVQNLAKQNRGYFSGRYENSRLGVNSSINVNTNAVILESLLYKARSDRPLAF
ncbi:MAG: DUF3131 domain-containing protein [Cyanobacteriota bacterium]